MSTVLVIDDDPALRDVMTVILESIGHRVVTAANGSRGLEAFRREKPELVITDILMPEKDGIESLREIRRMAPEMPVIAMSGGTAAGNMYFLTVAHKLGASATIEKPFRREQLLSVIRQVLPA
jgi:DNA-binding NtrC family response regulator